MALSEKDFKEIGPADLESLKENGIPEGGDIEYKQALQLDSSDQRKEFLKDVSGFANAGGGHLIFGIREDKGVPVEVCGIDLPDPDKAILTIGNLTRDRLDPRLSGFYVRAVALKNGKHAIVMRIRKSWNGPHGVDGRYYFRRSAGTSPMDTSELRNAFLESASIPEQIRRYRMERLALIEDGESPLGRTAAGKILAQIIPVASLNSGFRINWERIEIEHGIFPPFGRKGAKRLRFNLDGHLQSCITDAGVCDTYLQWFRNGIIESGDVWSLEHRKIYGEQFARDLALLVDRYRLAMDKLGIPFPIIVLCSFLGVKEFGMVPWFNARSNETVDRNNLIIPEVIISEPGIGTGAALRPICEAVWNSAGLILPQEFEVVPKE